MLTTRSTSSILVVLLPLCAPSIVIQGAEPKPTAEGMMIRAHEARAVWHDLPGLVADIVISTNGNVIEGQITVTSDGNLELTLPDSPHAQWAERRLQSLVSHRLPREGERTFNVDFADDITTHPLGRLIRFRDDPLHSVYRISDDVITEVHRTMGPTRFAISVLEVSRNAEGKHLPRAYSVSWWDAESGNLTACDMVRNEWVRVSRWDLPTKLLSVRTEDDGQRTVEQVVFRNHRILERSTSE
ncbi:MAG: DUF3386 family protein [Planctomycetota bacterium]|nr:DUF3386 family protein [Planctomycetota bacterium]